MPLVHVIADDFGLHPDIDRGIIACVEAGRVSGVSVAPTGRLIDWFAVRALSKQVQVGVHVTLVGEPWITAATFFDSWSTLLPWLLIPGRRGRLEAEVRAQVRRALDADVMPAHLDSHQHVHVMPKIWPIVRRVAEEHGIRRVRVPATPDRRIARQSLGGRALQRLAEARRTPDDLPCIGIARAGHNTVPRLIEELTLANGVDVELVAHPGHDTPALQARYREWHFDWKTEQAALLSDEWADGCARLGYRIGSPSDTSATDTA